MTQTVRFQTILILLTVALVATSCGRDKKPTSAPAPTETTAAAEDAVPANTPDLQEDTAVDSDQTVSPPSDATPTPIDGENTIITSTGLQYTESQAGTGATPKKGDIVAVHYTGTLSDGTVFDSSVERGEPIRFPLGAGRVIPGWDEGIALMSVGGKAILVIPPELAYGESGAGSAIPPNATIIFDVELVEVTEGAPESPTEVAEEEYETTDEGLKYFDFVVGDGPSPQPGQKVDVHYTGWLEDGTKFDSSLDSGELFSFNIGMGQVIAGWDLGVSTMNVGGKRQLVIPAELGYGETGAGGVIPPDATLTFEIELLDVQ